MPTSESGLAATVFHETRSSPPNPPSRVGSRLWHRGHTTPTCRHIQDAGSSTAVPAPTQPSPLPRHRRLHRQRGSHLLHVCMSQITRHLHHQHRSLSLPRALPDNTSHLSPITLTSLPPRTTHHIHTDKNQHTKKKKDIIMLYFHFHSAYLISTPPTHSTSPPPPRAIPKAPHSIVSIVSIIPDTPAREENIFAPWRQS